MRVISAPELAVLVDELQEFAGFYIDRFYEVSDSKFRMRLSRNKVKADLQIILSHAINKTQYIERQEQPSGFALSAKKEDRGIPDSEDKTVEQRQNSFA